MDSGFSVNAVWKNGWNSASLLLLLLPRRLQKKVSNPHFNGIIGRASEWRRLALKCKQQTSGVFIVARNLSSWLQNVFCSLLQATTRCLKHQEKCTKKCTKCLIGEVGEEYSGVRVTTCWPPLVPSILSSHPLSSSLFLFFLPYIKPFSFWRRQWWEIFFGSCPRQTGPGWADGVRDFPVEMYVNVLKERKRIKDDRQTWRAKCFLSQRRACSRRPGKSWEDQSEFWPTRLTWLLQIEHWEQRGDGCNNIFIISSFISCCCVIVIESTWQHDMWVCIDTNKWTLACCSVSVRVKSFYCIRFRNLQ